MSADVILDLEVETVRPVSTSITHLRYSTWSADLFLPLSWSTHMHTNPLDLQPCQNQSLCQNGATCVNDGVGSHRCFCPPGYTGDSCQFETDECYPNLCQNGGSCIV